MAPALQKTNTPLDLLMAVSSKHKRPRGELHLHRQGVQQRQHLPPTLLASVHPGQLRSSQVPGCLPHPGLGFRLGVRLGSRIDLRVRRHGYSARGAEAVEAGLEHV